MHALVDRDAAMLNPRTRADVVARILRRAAGLGPLDELLADPTIDEILVNGLEIPWIERGGKVERAKCAPFESDDALRAAVERVLAPLGRRVDESEPLCDARLPDGSRLNVVLPPLALDGPLVTIRRFRPSGLGPAELVEQGTWTDEMNALLAEAMQQRRCIVVSGGTGSGKTTTLGALMTFADPDDRIVTIEDTAELRLSQPHVVRLEARPPNVEGRGEITIRRLVRNALRMRPDRIVVGEVRGGEALDMLSAMTTGHDGSLSTVHAGSPAEALRRLETLALMADVGLPHAAIRDQIADAIDLIVHQARCPDGSRKVTAISEVVRGVAGPVTRDLVRSGS
ncbi:MAG TPA: ATPase, T2SS/T4P/T4SS family [Baekduia sp.]|nr:ATPase, T2SS/T4P/T4SS family [Baekduia sp.]